MSAPRLGRKYTVTEAAEYLGLSVGQIYRLTHRNQIRCLRTDGRTLQRRHKGKTVRYVKSGRVFFFEKHLDEWLEAHLSGSPAIAPAQRGATDQTSVDDLDAVMPRRLRFSR